MNIELKRDIYINDDGQLSYGRKQCYVTICNVKIAMPARLIFWLLSWFIPEKGHGTRIQ